MQNRVFPKLDFWGQTTTAILRGGGKPARTPRKPAREPPQTPTSPQAIPRKSQQVHKRSPTNPSKPTTMDGSLLFYYLGGVPPPRYISSKPPMVVDLLGFVGDPLWTCWGLRGISCGLAGVCGGSLAGLRGGLLRLAGCLLQGF